MNKICTSLEQSKKLIELGIDIKTADMHYYKNSFGDYIEGLYNSSDLKEGCELKGIEYIPAWSLTALLELIPNCRVESLNPKYFNCPDAPWIVFDNENHATENYNNPLDAAFEMICWLKENRKI